MPHKVRVSRSETTPGRVMNQHWEKESGINRSGSSLMLITTVLWERVLFLWLSKTSVFGRFKKKKRLQSHERISRTGQTCTYKNNTHSGEFTQTHTTLWHCVFILLRKQASYFHAITQVTDI